MNKLDFKALIKSFIKLSKNLRNDKGVWIRLQFIYT